jgi:hypothetical protein
LRSRAWDVSGINIIRAEKSQRNVIVFSVANFLFAYDAIKIVKTSTLSAIYRLYERYIVQ